MKKVYTFLAVAAITLTAGATGVKGLNNFKTPAAKLLETKTLNATAAVSAKASSVQELATEHKAVAGKAPKKASEIITEAPAGELKYYERSGGAFYVSNSYLYEDEQEGLIEIVFADGGEVYIKDIVNYFQAGTYVKGTLSGNTITVPLGQTLYSWTGYGYGAELSFVNIVREDGQVQNTADCSRDTEATEATFTVDDAAGTITLNGSSADHVLGAVYDDDSSWLGRGDYLSVYTEAQLEEPLTPPAGLDAEQYYIVGDYYRSGSKKIAGTVNVIKDGNDVYVQGLGTGSEDEGDVVLPEAWVKGTLADGVLTIPSGQYLGLYGSSQIYLCGYEGSTNEFGVDITFAYDEAADEFTADNYVFVNGKRDEMYYFLYFSPGLKLTKEEPVAPELVELPEGAEPEEWLFAAFDTYYEEVITNPSLVYFDGNDVYVNGVTAALPDSYIKGTLADGKVTFPANQYLGVMQSIFGDMEMFFSPDADVVFDYDAEVGKLTTAAYVNTAEGSPYDEYEDIVITKVIEKAAVPATPEITNFKAEDVSYPYVEAKIPSVDVDGNPMLTAKVSYLVLIEDADKNVAPLTFTADLYSKLDEDITELPYLFTDNYDIVNSGDVHRVYLNQGVEEILNWNKIGFQTIYRGGGEENKSEIAWYVINNATAVADVTAAKTVASETYFNLAGQQSSKAFDGVNIVVRTYTDGTTKAVKVIR